jgi:hypothetical protein
MNVSSPPPLNMHSSNFEYQPASNFFKLNLNSSSFVSSSYETIEYFDRELINSLNQHDSKLVGKYDLETAKNEGSRPISLLTVSSNDTIKNDDLIIDELDDEDVELIEGYKNEFLVNFRRFPIENSKHKMQNLKNYRQTSDNSSRFLNEKIESLHKTLEQFFNFDDAINADVFQTEQLNNIYSEPFDQVNNESLTNTTNDTSVNFDYKEDVDSGLSSRCSNDNSNANRLFFNFNNYNNSLYFNRLSNNFTDNEFLDDTCSSHYQEIVDNSNNMTNQSENIDERELDESYYGIKNERDEFHSNSRESKKESIIGLTSNKKPVSSCSSPSTSLFERLFKKNFTKKFKFF